jgi:hypothetical protein
MSGPFAGQCKEDDSNKAVILGNGVGFAYSGLADIDGVKMDLWLADTLADARVRTLSDACAAIESRATEAVRWLRCPAWTKRHTFVGVGWAQFALDKPFQPTICVISNAQDEHGNWLSEAKNKFVTGGLYMPDDARVSLVNTGQPLRHDEKYWVFRNIYKCISRELGPVPILRLLAVGIRRVAARSALVGNNPMALSLPIGSAYSDMYADTMSLPQPNVPSFCFLPENETNFVRDSPWVVNEYFIGQLQSSRVRRNFAEPDP